MKPKPQRVFRPERFIADSCPLCGKLRMFVSVDAAEGYFVTEFDGEPVCSWEEQRDPPHTFVAGCQREKHAEEENPN
ncbi:MAG TPA: hypothetical protein VF420_13310 [Casimicrobiaceae bacterium]